MSFSNFATPADHERITELLGRTPQGDFEVVVRNAAGDPVVVRNAPLLDDGTPMPTRFWLVGITETLAVGRLEAAGGVNQAEFEIDPALLARAHLEYAKERDAQIPATHTGPRPHGGVGGTRIGVKCLHAHYGWWLAGGNDPVGAWVAGKLATSITDYVVTSDIGPPDRRLVGSLAAIDIGTNSTNLLIIDRDGHELVREVHMTRLGEAVTKTNELSPEAIVRTLQRLNEYKSLIAHYGVGTLRVVATEACRRATNASTFFDAVHTIFGQGPDLLSGGDEGRLTYRGALEGFPSSNESTIVIDIGGGSTEVMLGTVMLTHVVSIPLGAIVITESEFHHDPPRPEELTNAIGLVTDFVEDITRERPEVRGATRVIGVAGTIVTIAAVELGLHTFDTARLHGMILTRDAVEEVFRTLATETLADRRHNPGLPAQRADIIVGGCCLLVAIMRKLQLNSITVSTRNILDGIASELRSGDLS